MSNLSEIQGLDVSVVIPALNAENYLPVLIRSIESQSLLPKEIVIVDSSISNKTSDIFEKWSGPIPIIFKRVEFAYPGKARNIGVALSSNEWIAFIDCRMLPNNNWLEACTFSAKATGADFVNGLFVCDADTYFKNTLRAATYGHATIKSLAGGLVSRKSFLQSGGFQNVRAGEDIEWLHRIEKLGFKIINAGSSSIKYQGLQETLMGFLIKSWVYAFTNAYLQIKSTQKILYFLITLILSIIFVYRLNWLGFVFMPWEPINSQYFAPHITKIYVVLVFIAYMVYRGIVRPLNVAVRASFLLPWRWLGVSFTGILIDFVKAPGLLWGAWLMFVRRYSGFFRVEKNNILDSYLEDMDAEVADGFRNK